MKIFNTKKLQEEWQKKVETSYNQGKKDAENEFNNIYNYCSHFAYLSYLKNYLKY